MLIAGNAVEPLASLRDEEWSGTLKTSKQTDVKKKNL